MPTAEPGTALSQPFVVEAVDATGKPMPGVKVDWAVLSGGGTAAPSTSTTGPDGRAQASWTLGMALGAQSLEARAGESAVGFSATAAQATSLRLVEGTDQHAPAGSKLTLPLLVRATVGGSADAAGVEGTGIQWEVLTGGGSVQASSERTDTGGEAQAEWTLGSAGEQTVRATMGPQSVTFRATLLTAAAAASCGLSAGTNNYLSLAAPNASYAFSSRATMRTLLLYVDFSDAVATETFEALSELLVASSRPVLTALSRGRFSLDVTEHRVWLRMPKPSSQYGLADGATFAEHKTYIADATALANASVDYSRFDAVFIVAAKGAQVPISPTFVPGTGNGIVLDGKELRHAITFGEDIRSTGANYGRNVLIHETGHLLGLPDLYRFSQPYPAYLADAGGWTTMSWTGTPIAHFAGWEKWILGWMDNGQVACLSGPGTQVVALSPVQSETGTLMSVVKLSATKAVVVEARSAALLCDAGVLVYEVDAQIATGQGPLKVHAAQSGMDSVNSNRCGPKYDAPLDLGTGEVASYTLSASGVTLQVLAEQSGGWVVRVSRP